MENNSLSLEQVRGTAPVSDPVKTLLWVLGRHTLSAAACMQKPGLSHRATFGKNQLQPALDAGLIERTLPDKANSRLQ